MRNLDLDLLRTLVAIADHGTFAAAAQRLHRTQSAVTQQMQRLEEQVALALFERHGRGKQLTRHGNKLVEYARQLLNLNDEALRVLREGDLTGSLRIGAPHDVADTILPPLLSHIARASPALRLEIHVGRSPFLMESLRRGEIDLTVSTREDTSLDGLVLRTSPTIWLCAADFAYESGSMVPLILADEPSLFRKLALDALKESGVPWRAAYFAPSLIGIKAAIRAGLGITARSIDLLGADMRVLGDKDGLPRLPDVTYYLWARPNAANPVARQVFSMLKTTLQRGITAV
ncbi:LysR substrate-binding domain-containing protein [Cupriavidus basilensis]|uniref:LysR substrate-binding domain-containing protein n=1 Tax=Cupriavidus basilensis TaxID=68895 RepID=UPI0020A66536|nr:LysR substrate-binding domain-containing protein [Cupriavidus basilensis]MCP3021723.1 LysR substrate-binding domain-containing protein [Cupriavidus basilensis]MDR3380224.1 LysR substrate-binding domain-containing protein [Cupriavidus basilensis]